MNNFIRMFISFALISFVSFAQSGPTEVDINAPFVVNPNPNVHNPSFDIPLEEVFGLNQNGFSAGPRSRGNLFTCTTARKIIEHRMYLAPTVATQMWFCIYEGATQVGIYNLVSSVDVSPQGPGEGWYTSGPIDYDMIPGMFYLIFASFEQPSGYWNENPVTPYPIPASFGELTAGAGWNYAPTSVFPPDATQDVTAIAFGDPVAYYQTIVTDDIGGGGPAVPYIDDFEGFTVGGQLACQDPVNWDTWSSLPCDPVEDAFISDNYAYSGTNSVVFIQNNDVIKFFDTQTSGKWDIGWKMYIPAGKAGYFNLMAEALVLWDIEVYFDVGGGGRVLTGDPEEAFAWTEDTWQQVRIVVDLDTDAAEFWLDGSLVKSWAWTNGTSGTCPLVLDVADFFGGTANDEMYIDDFMFGQFPFVPVELTSFTANVNHSGQVELNWSTASETNNQLFEIERRTTDGQFATIGYVEGQGTTTEPQHYSYTDATVNTGIYYYRLKQLDFLGYYEYFDEIEVDVNGPLSFDLEQNYPNPFNPSTNIKFSIPESGDVRLAVYNLVGEEVAVLVDGFSETGFFEVTFDASSLPSGAYFYKLQSGSSVVAKKMLLMK